MYVYICVYIYIYVYVYVLLGSYTAAMYVLAYVSVYAYDRLVGTSTGLLFLPSVMFVLHPVYLFIFMWPAEPANPCCRL